MGGWGRQNPWPIQWGGGQSEFERLWSALRGLLGEKGAGPIDGLEDAWRESVTAGLLPAATIDERAVFQAMPPWCTDHLALIEEEVGLDAAGTEQQRREAAWVAWCGVDSSINPELVASLQSIDPNISIVLLDPDETANWQFGRGYATAGVPIPGMAAQRYSAWPNYSDDHILHLSWSSCPLGIPPVAEKALVEKLLNRALPAWVDYVITTGAILYCDGFMDARLDLTPLGA